MGATKNSLSRDMQPPESSRGLRTSNTIEHDVVLPRGLHPSLPAVSAERFAWVRHDIRSTWRRANLCAQRQQSRAIQEPSFPCRHPLTLQLCECLLARSGTISELRRAGANGTAGLKPTRSTSPSAPNILRPCETAETPNKYGPSCANLCTAKEVELLKPGIFSLGPVFSAAPDFANLVG